jgi:hypothetical protein
MKLSRLAIILDNIHRGSHLELERELSHLRGVTCPGLEEATRRLELSYDARHISKTEILDVVRRLGYAWTREQS